MRWLVGDIQGCARELDDLLRERILPALEAEGLDYDIYRQSIREEIIIRRLRSRERTTPARNRNVISVNSDVALAIPASQP